MGREPHSLERWVLLSAFDRKVRKCAAISCSFAEAEIPQPIKELGESAAVPLKPLGKGSTAQEPSGMEARKLSAAERSASSSPAFPS